MAKRGSNLFNVDLDSIPSVLSQANVAIIEELKGELVETTRVLKNGLEPETSELRLAHQKLNNLKKKFADARLSDGRPFSDATKSVKAWFERYEREVQAALERIQTCMDRLLTRGSEDSNLYIEPTASSDSLSEHLVEANPAETVEGLHATWVVDTFDRRVLDLEALRNYLTDHAIESALSKHLRETGTPSIAGVRYRKSARI